MSIVIIVIGYKCGQPSGIDQRGLISRKNERNMEMSKHNPVYEWHFIVARLRSTKIGSANFQIKQNVSSIYLNRN